MFGTKQIILFKKHDFVTFILYPAKKYFDTVFGIRYKTALSLEKRCEESDVHDSVDSDNDIMQKKTHFR